MIRSLTVAALGLALAGCVQMQVNNAQVFADMAAQIAANCPAAAEEAKAAQQAAADAAQAAELMSFCSDRAETLQDQVDYWNQQAALHEARTEAEEGEARRLQGELKGTIAAWEATARACGEAASCADTVVTPGEILCANRDRDMRICGCSDRRSCETARDQANARVAEGPSDLKRQVEAAEQAARDSRELAEQARNEASQLTGEEGEPTYYDGERVYDDLPGMQQCMSNAATDLRVAEEDAQKAAEDAAEACDVSLFADAPPPDGTYPQDIYGSQNRGAGGSCSPGMAATCAGIQIQCVASCGPGGVGGCSPGAPAQCPACFAAGCI